MKQKLCVFLIIFSLFPLLVLHHSDARFLPTHQQVEGKIIHNKIIYDEGSFQGNDDIDRLDVLMGLEGCDKKDEECMKRRMVAEAHLDYIYTQHHKP